MPSANNTSSTITWKSPTATNSHSTSPATCSTEEKSWPVQLYRFTQDEGWEQMIFSKNDNTNIINNIVDNDTNTPQIHNDNEEGSSCFVAAVPRKDCIVLPSLKQKFSLMSGDGSSRDSATASTSSSSIISNGKSYAIRRGQCILLISRKRHRAMVLKFASLKHCLEFSDRFVQLNPPTELPLLPLVESSSLSSSSSCPPSQPFVSGEQAAASAAAMMLPSQKQNQDRDQDPEPMALEEDRDQKQRQEQVVSYMTRLLHDDVFLQFVNKLEGFLQGTTDGALLLQSLAFRDRNHGQIYFN